MYFLCERNTDSLDAIEDANCPFRSERPDRTLERARRKTVSVLGDNRANVRIRRVQAFLAPTLPDRASTQPFCLSVVARGVGRLLRAMSPHRPTLPLAHCEVMREAAPSALTRRGTTRPAGSAQAAIPYATMVATGTAARRRYPEQQSNPAAELRKSRRRPDERTGL